jgi:hypothetical protein
MCGRVGSCNQKRGVSPSCPACRARFARGHQFWWATVHPIFQAPRRKKTNSGQFWYSEASMSPGFTPMERSYERSELREPSQEQTNHGNLV